MHTRYCNVHILISVKYYFSSYLYNKYKSIFYTFQKMIILLLKEHNIVQNIFECLISIQGMNNTEVII